MSNETLFYVCGGVLAVSAVVTTFAGLKLKGFPGRGFSLVVIWFAVFVVGAATFAVRYSNEEQEHRAAELEKAGEEIEAAENEGGFGNEGGALGGETEEGEEEAEEAEEGPEEEEPVGPTAGEASSTTLDLAADPTALAFDKTELEAKAGKVTIDFTNPSAIPHNVVIEEDGKELAGFEPIAESEETLEAELEPGTYEFICSVPGHAEAGMKGTLTVE
ncbi:MAG TPA: plastocyanin/azurin family copper-binding protein [Solirubrobacterales bacterium]|nr:plastocyanin/azurin family copper-binding protein [Solirubrobacterales bacterium]